RAVHPGDVPPQRLGGRCFPGRLGRDHGRLPAAGGEVRPARIAHRGARGLGAGGVRPGPVRVQHRVAARGGAGPEGGPAGLAARPLRLARLRGRGARGSGRARDRPDDSPGRGADRRMTGSTPAAGWDLRILSWNLWELRGDLHALVEAVQDLNPDLMLVQEAPRFVLPTTRLRWFARQVERRILLGGWGGRGLALLATDEVAAQVIRRGAHPVAQTVSDLNSTYPRGVAAVRLSVPGGREVVVAATHLALQEDNRMRHAEHLRELVRAAGAPAIVGGDLNETA